MSTKSGHHPIIIKKRRGKKGGEAHHGGAWKVAYADFVTAMMAFFLLMWLLNATTEEQRKGLADYFNPSIPISRISGGGADALNGSSVFSDDDLARDGAGAPAAHSADGKTKAEKAAEDAARAKLEAIEQRIAAEKSAGADELADHIETRMTPDGLVVELVEREGEPLFEVGSSAPSGLLHRLLTIVAPVLATAENDMAIVGHTDSRAYAGVGPYSNWELSSERAQVARRLLVESGIPPDQIASVIGKADREPIAEDRFAARNRRIGVILLAFKPSRGVENSSADYPLLKDPAIQP